MLKPDDADKAIINETCARRLGLDDPIGKKINIHQGVTIVGIVKTSIIQHLQSRQHLLYSAIKEVWEVPIPMPTMVIY